MRKSDERPRTTSGPAKGVIRTQCPVCGSGSIRVRAEPPIASGYCFTCGSTWTQVRRAGEWSISIDPPPPRQT